MWFMFGIVLDSVWFMPSLIVNVCLVHVRLMASLMLFHLWFILGLCVVNVLVYCWFMFGLVLVHFGLYANGFNFWAIVWLMF